MKGDSRHTNTFNWSRARVDGDSTSSKLSRLSSLALGMDGDMGNFPRILAELPKVDRRLPAIDALKVELDENDQRKALTISERVALAEAVAEKLAGRQGSGPAKRVGNISHSYDQGRTTDLAASKAGLGSGKTLEAAQQVIAKGVPESPTVTKASTAKPYFLRWCKPAECYLLNSRDASICAVSKGKVSKAVSTESGICAWLPKCRLTSWLTRKSTFSGWLTAKAHLLEL